MTEYLVLFCLVFLIVPVSILAMLRLMTIVYGPRDDSLYHRQLYREMVRRSVPEIIVYWLLLFGLLVGLVLYFFRI